VVRRPLREKLPGPGPRTPWPCYAAPRAQVRAGFARLPLDRYPNIAAVAPDFYTDMDVQYLYGPAPR
jgi:hypothetical protein